MVRALFRSSFCALVFLFMAGPVSAISINFTPKGQQLDGDAILDIATSPNSVVSFTVSYAPTGSTNPLQFIGYDLRYDPNELQSIGIVASNAFASNNGTLVENGHLRLEHADGSVGPGGGPVTLDSLDFRVLPGLKNDGIKDLFFGGVANNPVGDTVTFSQIVEVQPTIPEPEISMLLLIGLMAMLGIANRRRLASSLRH